MSKSFYWHDYESFGANPRLDRPCQFAGQRTDENLDPVGEPLVIYCQPPDDLLPHPQACLITGITPQSALERGIPEPDFIRQVLGELGRPGTCGVGYNSLRFDDELTRHTAWRNFHDPYAREWRDGCSRWDIIDMLRLCYALRPEGIQWPRREDGAPSFKLEALSIANDLEHASAHDALSDVQATIALARLARERQPRLYAFVEGNRSKAAARKLLDPDAHAPVVHVSSRFPAEQGCLSLVMPLLVNPGNANAVICFDLRHDPAPLLELDAADIHERIFTPAADLPEDVERIAIKAVHLNKCPVLAPPATLQPEQARRLQLDTTLAQSRHEALLASLPDVALKLAEVYAMGEFGPASDPEQDLYGGFINDADRRLCEQITRATPPELAGLDPSFRDRRLGDIWLRYRARHFPETLNDVEREEWARLRSRRLEFAADGGLSLDQHDALVDELVVGADDQRTAILEALREWSAQLRASL